MKNTLITLVSLLIIGCASKGSLVERKVTPDQYYRVWEYSKALVISGSLDFISINNVTPHKRVLRVYINDQVAIEDTLKQDDDELKGRWNDKKISATCYRSNAKNLRCLVYVGNERTVTLSF
jgi:hypothetical protein